MFSWLTPDPGREELLCVLQHPSFPSAGSSDLGLQDVAAGTEPHFNRAQDFSWPIKPPYLKVAWLDMSYLLLLKSFP